jgi:serine/threonine-protein kinase HipA
MIMSKKINVYADWIGLKVPNQMGILTTVQTRGKEIFSFEYTQDWILSGQSQSIDPKLQFYTGLQFNQEDKPNFGVFLDSSPDRWGRLLMKRREAIIARKEDRKPKVLLESDFLLGVYDEHRIGALRFKLNPEADFLSADKALAAPPWASLRDLEYASLQLEADHDEADEEAIKWLNLLIAPGASLGGARPKASIKDAQGSLWIAKFPSGNDDRDIGAWEYVAMQIAKEAGLCVTDFEIRQFSSKHHTYLSRRFDRTEKVERIHFASAMTLLGYNDGADHQDGISYLELVEFLIQQGANVDADLKELWTRIVLNICLKNTDDHLRNHGFLLVENGWKLSPLYDVNPFAEGLGLTLNISEDDNSLNLDLAMSVIDYFRLKEKEAKAIMNRVQQSVSNWRKIAGEIKISRAEQNRMEAAFVL